MCLCVCVFVWSCSCTEILSSSNVDHVELVSCVVWTRGCQFTCETCTEVVRGSADLQEMAATVHAGCYWGMQLEQCRSGGVGPVSELLRLQNRGPSIFWTRPRWSIASQRIASAAALKRATSSRWQSCWPCCCQSSRTMLPAGTGDDSVRHHAAFAIHCVLSSQQLLIALAQLLLLLRHKK